MVRIEGRFWYKNTKVFLLVLLQHPGDKVKVFMDKNVPLYAGLAVLDTRLYPPSYIAIYQFFFGMGVIALLLEYGIREDHIRLLPRRPFFTRLIARKKKSGVPLLGARTRCAEYRHESRRIYIRKKLLCTQKYFPHLNED